MRKATNARDVELLVRSLLFLFLAACSSADLSDGVATATPASDDRAAAIAQAKTCIDKNGYRSVWGTTLMFEKVTASLSRDRVWYVDFPESGNDSAGNVVALGLPSGLMVAVDLDAKTCRRVMLE